MIAALLCGNHVTYRFGKGMMPKAYRLNADSMAVIMDNYASQLAEQYGEDVANDVLSRSRSNVALDSLSYNSHSGTGHNNRLSSYSTTGKDSGYGPGGPYGNYGTGGSGYGPIERTGSDEGKRG
jgi:hypothetical protein